MAVSDALVQRNFVWVKMAQSPINALLSMNQAQNMSKDDHVCVPTMTWAPAGFLALGCEYAYDVGSNPADVKAAAHHSSVIVLNAQLPDLPITLWRLGPFRIQQMSFAADSSALCVLGTPKEGKEVIDKGEVPFGTSGANNAQHGSLAHIIHFI